MRRICLPKARRKSNWLRVLLLSSSTAVVALSSGAVHNLVAQNYVELRVGQSKNGTYRYTEFTHTFPEKIVIDLLYLGVPGQNELYAGVGYQLKPNKALTITPLLYGVIGKENNERGIAPGVFVSASKRGWNINAFLGHFEPLEGNVPRYTFLDSLDVTKKRKKVELGVSTGFYHIAGNWNPLFGPLIVKNDERGSWRLSLRGGSALEVRLTRTLNF